MSLDNPNSSAKDFGFEGHYLLWPPHAGRQIPKEVTGSVRDDYRQAILVLSLSPAASAALSRRCLQTVLREKGGASQHDLSHQIEAVIPHLPSHIADNVDAIRAIGNFAAHPTKSTASGEIMDVEPGEAEWLLDVLDSLFDFYYIQPARAKMKRDAIDAKLAEAGKPPTKKAVP